MDNRLLRWLESQKQKPVYEDAEDSGVDWSLNREMSLGLWFMGEALGWQVQPWDGGFASWPDWFVQDVMTIHERRAQLRELVSQSQAPTRQLGGDWSKADGD